ncbi:MAG: aminotransferase class I/II-fold pyridoxal phosphate-dependent enzyme, partial [Candidatus Peribacteraceae bacterium]|nr:aminotransferase class I/II-fold pyridoxal phosphate-dependent enzyme [Candidatus Peribacteraceae bacterium]
VKFEEKWNKWLGSEYSVFCNSGSSANLLMYYTLLQSNLLKNNKVIVPSAGWITSVSPAIQLGFNPIMCEADKDTFGLDLNHLEDLLKKNQPSTVFLVHVLGVPHKMKELLELKEKYGFFLLEDACASVGSSYHDRKIGTFGDMAAFSLYFGHQLSTIEGGIVSTNNKTLNDILLMLRSHGWSKDLDRDSHDKLVKQYGFDDFHTPFVFYIPGLNLRATDLNAFLGILQIEKFDWVIKRRMENHAKYREKLKNNFYIQKYDNNSTVCSISFGVLAENSNHRKSIVKTLEENFIETRIFSAGNLGLHPFWTNLYGKPSFPMADKIYDCGFFLPNHPSLKNEDIDFISDIVLHSLD